MTAKEKNETRSGAEWGLQNRCSTTELTRQINDLQDRSEAWLQLVAVSSRNSRPAPLEPHLCLRRPGKCPPLSARPREGHPATLAWRGRRCGDPAWPWIPAFAGMSGVCCTVGSSLLRECVLRLRISPTRFQAVATAREVDEKFLTDERNPSRGWALCWWNELYDPLSSFVPVLEPRPRRGFSFGERRDRSRNRSLVVGRIRPSSGAGYRTQAPPGSSRVAGVEVGWSLQLALLGHRGAARGALLTAPAETLLRDVVLARPAVFAGLTYEGLLANGLTHSLRP